MLGKEEEAGGEGGRGGELGLILPDSVIACTAYQPDFLITCLLVVEQELSADTCSYQSAPRPQGEAEPRPRILPSQPPAPDLPRGVERADHGSEPQQTEEVLGPQRVSLGGSELPVTEVTKAEETGESRCLGLSCGPQQDRLLVHRGPERCHPELGT